MPTHFRDGQAPVVHFDPLVEVSPFLLFRRLKEGRGPRLVDVRARPDEGKAAEGAPGESTRDEHTPGRRTLKGAEHHPEPGWEPPVDEDVVLFDEDGSEAVPRARELQAQGFPRVRALFGGLELYEFSLDPEVVGEETFLERA